MTHEALCVNKKICIVKWTDNGYSLWSFVYGGNSLNEIT